MKKILAAGIIAGVAFAARYPIVVEYRYLKNCIQKPDAEEYCICTLKELEKKYTLAQFVELSQQSKDKLLTTLMPVFKKCISEIKY